MLGIPLAEVEIDARLVSQLLAHQHPDLQQLPIQFIDAGWDNAMFRLGERLVVRLPRRSIAAKLIETEQRWLPQLAPQLPLAIPVPIRVGAPSSLYPWHWSIIDWMHGQTVGKFPLTANCARQFGRFLKALHVTPPLDAPQNPVRGVPLFQRATMLTERLERVSSAIEPILPALQSIWHQAVDAPIDVDPTWIHGDLHPRNILIDNSGITGIIDWGDLAAGDRATDLAALWYLFPDLQLRAQAIDNYGKISAATMARAKGWAMLFGIVFLDAGSIDRSATAQLGRDILECVARS